MISRFPGKKRCRGAAHGHIIDLGVTIVGYDGRRAALCPVMIHDTVTQNDDLHIMFVFLCVLIIFLCVLFVRFFLFLCLITLTVRLVRLLHHLGLFCIGVLTACRLS